MSDTKLVVNELALGRTRKALNDYIRMTDGVLD